MVDERRRARSSGPGARGPRTGPGSGPGRSRPAARGGASRRPAAGRGAAPRRPRFTGRAAILVLVLAVLTVSYASSLRAYLTQREHLDDLRAQIDATQAEIHELEREKRRWEDPAYVETQARERLDYVMPGETSYVVVQPDGTPLDATSTLSEPVDRPDDEVTTAWWDTAWDSVEAAGDPEGAAAADPPPAASIPAPTPEETE